MHKGLVALVPEATVRWYNNQIGTTSTTSMKHVMIIVTKALIRPLVK